jgi:serine/threonine protein kinase
MPTDLTSGVVLGETYRLVERIGRGGMGEVWRAEHTRLPRQFAVKVLHGAAAANETALARFRREAEIASRLGHPNIVAVLDFNTLDDGTPYMVMELLEGQSLRDRAKQGPISLADVVRILRQVASALRAAHRQGVIHRDLKPDNIFLCNEDLDGRPYERAKVLDFGISKIQGSETVVTRDAEVLGTPIYMAPEQAAGRHTLVDGRTDEFALAAIAYELLSGQIAFGGETLVEVVNKIMNGTPPPLDRAVPTLPSHVVAAIDRALSKERDQRYPEITEFVNALAGDPALVSTTAQDDDIPTEPRNPPPVAASAGFEATAASADGLPPAAALGATMPSQDRMPAAGRPLASEDEASVVTGGPAAPGAPAATRAPAAEAPAAVAVTGPPGPAPRRRSVGFVVAFALGGIALAAAGALVAIKLTDRTTRAPGTPTPAEEASLDRQRGGSDRPTPAVGSDSSVEASPTPDPSSKTSAGGNEGEQAADDTGAPADAATLMGSDTTSVGAADAGVASNQKSTPRPQPKSKRTPRAQTRRERLPATVAAELKQAEAALRRGNANDALHLARRSLRSYKSTRAFAVMVRAYCLRRDLRMAKAMLRRLRGATRRRTTRWCRNNGFDIGR